MLYKNTAELIQSYINCACEYLINSNGMHVNVQLLKNGIENTHVKMIPFDFLQRN